jgi:hypothetical protein
MEYFLIKPNGETTGTYSIEQVRAMLAAGYIGQDTRYWHEGITGWQPIDRIEESLQFEPPPPPPSKTVPPQKLAAVLKAVPPPATKLEKPKEPETPRKVGGPSIPAATRVPSPLVEEAIPSGEVPAREASAVVPPSRKLPSKSPRLLERLLFSTLGALLMLAVLRGPAAVRYISDQLTDKIILTDTSNFVLLDPATIKPFTQDMHSSPVIEALQSQITQTTDPVALARLKINVDTEISHHTDETREQYLRAHSALNIDAGTYRILAYYDDKGGGFKPRKGQAAWVAIHYRDQTVYAFRPATSPPAAP